jgi:hypothetical protein
MQEARINPNPTKLTTRKAAVPITRSNVFPGRSFDRGRSTRALLAKAVEAEVNDKHSHPRQFHPNCFSTDSALGR